MTDITTIPAVNQGFSTSSQEVSTSDYNIEQQPEIAMWLPTTGTKTDSVEIPTASPEFSTVTRQARITCRHVIATMADNRKLQYSRFAHQSRNFWQSIVVAIIWLIFCLPGHHR